MYKRQITFSAYTYAQLGAEAFTLELGKARAFGQNELVNLCLLYTSGCPWRNDACSWSNDGFCMDVPAVRTAHPAVCITPR